MRYLLPFLLLLAPAAAATRAPSSPILFEENRGQTSNLVRYVARAPHQNIYFSNAGVYFELWGQGDMSSVVHLSFAGASPAARWQASQPAPAGITYQVGSDRARWVHDAPRYKTLTLRGLYPGIDAVFYEADGRLEYDLVLAPGADPRQVRLRFQHDGRIAGQPGGALEIQTPAGTLRQRPPRLFQQHNGARTEVAGRFAPAGANEFVLETGPYDRTAALVVDPVLEFSSYLGGDSDDEVVAVGDTFVAGNTTSIAFPGAPAARRRSRDVFVRGLPNSNTGSATFYGAVVVGGSGDDELLTAAIYISGRRITCYLAGASDSTDFTGLNSTYTPKFSGGRSDGFLANLLFDSTSLASVTVEFFGGQGDDRITSVSTYASSLFFAGTTTSPDLPVKQAFQPAPGGGLDGFVGVIPYGSVLGSQSLLSYLGGSGDDRPLGTIQFSSNSSLLVAGETSSADFPVTGGPSLSGPTDAFLTRIEASPLIDGSGTSRITASRLTGGSGADRIVSVSAPPGIVPKFILAAGTTSSKDLPLLDAWQAAYGGGSSDAFVARFSPTTLEPLFSTYLGGSGADESTSSAVNTAGELAVAGHTLSTDLPVVDPLQPKPAGGIDAFLAHADSSGTLRHLTYFGGSGDDIARGVAFRATGVRIGGSTNSTDLPLLSPFQNAKDAGLDGFFADIGTSVVSGPDLLYLGKDTLRTVTLSLGRTLQTGFLRVRTSDPSKLRLFQNGAPADDITLTTLQFSAMGLADSGEATLTVSAEGFPDKLIRVALRPVVLRVSNSATQRVLTWSEPLSLFYNLWTVDPATGEPLEAVARRYDIPALNITWTSSDPAVATIGATQYGGPAAVPAGPGSTRISLSCDSIPVVQPDSFLLEVERPGVSSRPHFLGGGLQTNLQFGFALTAGMDVPYDLALPHRGTLTLRSSDPSRVVLSLDSSKPGRESVEVKAISSGSRPYFPTVYAQALASEGEARVTLSSPELQGDFDIPITLAPPALRLTSGAYPDPQNPILPVNNTTSLYASLSYEGAPQKNNSGYILNPGAAPFNVTIRSASPEVASVTGGAFLFGSSPNITLRGVAPGESEITCTTTWPELRIAGSLRATVVTQQPPKAPDLLVGRNLMTGLYFSWPGATTDLELEVSDPAVALLSNDARSTGQSKISLRYGAMFYVHGLKEGATDLRIRAAGLGEITGAINVLPSGIAFSASFQEFLFYSTSTSGPSVAPYVLDDLTLIPLTPQLPRPGLSIPVTLKTAGDSVALTPTTLTLDNSSYSRNLGFSIRALGDTTVAIEPPAGWTTPARSTTTTLRISHAQLRLANTAMAVRDVVTQNQVAVNGGSTSVPVTVTSLDPSRLLVSIPNGTPAAAVTLPPGGLFSLHALASSGAVKLRLTADNATPAEVGVPLYEPRLGVTSYLAQPLKFSLPSSPASVTLSLGTTVASGTLTLRPGVPPVRISLTSSNPAVARVSPDFVEITPTNSSASFTITPLTPGDTRIVLEAPSAFPLSLSSMDVTVGRQGLALRSFVVSRNLQSATELRGESNLPAADNTIITVTSLTPERLLLARNTTDAGAASTNVLWSAGSYSSQTLYVQALQEGDARLLLSAPGYQDTTITVPVYPTAVTLSPRDLPTVLGSENSVYANLASAVGTPPVYQTGVTYGLRPGAPEVTVPLTVADPQVASLAATSLTIRHPNPNSPGASASVQVKGLALGNTTVTAAVPDGYADPGPAFRQTSVEVLPRTMNFNCGLTFRLPKDTQQTCQTFLSPGTTARAVSSHPALLSVSTDARAAGAGEASATATEQPLQFTFQSLADEGVATVTISAPGYKDTVFTLTLGRSGFVLVHPYGASTPNLLLQKGSALDLRLVLREVAQDGTPTGYEQTLRAGLPAVWIAVSSSNPSAATLSAPFFTINPGNIATTVRLQAVAPGNTLVKITPPAGFTDSGRNTLLVEVQ